jgi:hypothetical protein
MARTLGGRRAVGILRVVLSASRYGNYAITARSISEFDSHRASKFRRPARSSNA